METAKLCHHSRTQKHDEGAVADEGALPPLADAPFSTKGLGQLKGSGSATLHRFPGGKGLVADPTKGKLIQSTLPEDGNVTLLTYTDRSAPSRCSDPITPDDLQRSSRYD
jgi:hypothetical protein